jgi:hypothetical protein
MCLFVNALGCPNRDTALSNQNSGAGIIYNLNLLTIGFTQPQYSVLEGQHVTVTVDRVASAAAIADVLFFISTSDRNAVASTQQQLQLFYGITNGSVPYPLTMADQTGLTGLAMARTQYYGSSHNESLWVDGMYDYHGIADYVPINNPYSFLTEYSNLTDFVVTNPDTILERPDEVFALNINGPGVWPSPLGPLFTRVTILDGGDGYRDGTTQYDKLYHSPPVERGQLGHSVSVAIKYDIVAVGSPTSDSLSVSAAGMVTIYNKRVDGKWAQLPDIFSPNPTKNARFGDDVIVRDIYNRDVVLLVVGEPNAQAVHVYACHPAVDSTRWSLEKSLSVSQAFAPQHRFGAKGTLGLYGDLLVVGSPGLDVVFVFTRSFNNSSSAWVWSEGIQLLERYQLLHPYQHQQKQYLDSFHLIQEQLF